MSDPLENVDIGKILDKIIPYLGDMTPEQKREYILRLAEAIARGAAEGAVRGQVCNK